MAQGRVPGQLILPLLAAAAWALTAARMDGMDTSPAGDLGSLGWFGTTWLLMMAAMMLPSLVRVVPERVPSEAPFVAGYLLAWTAAGLAAYAGIEAVRALGPGFLEWDDAGPYAAGGVIAVAALYELTPLKHACLRRCRAPAAAADGALHAGLKNGTACVGCCWALMAALFALGAMSLVWMAVIAAVVAVEKLLPWRRITTPAVALLLVVLAAAVAYAPGSLPGFTEPDGAPMQHEMGEMGG